MFKVCVFEVFVVLSMFLYELFRLLCLKVFINITISITCSYNFWKFPSDPIIRSSLDEKGEPHGSLPFRIKEEFWKWVHIWSNNWTNKKQKQKAELSTFFEVGKNEF